MILLENCKTSGSSKSGPRYSSIAGFTLIELMVTLAIAAILATIAIPSFTALALSSKLKSISSSFVASVQFARSEAIKRNTAVSLCATDNDEGTCAGTWANGWVVGYTDNTVSPAVWQVIRREAALPSGYLLQGGGVTSLVFQSTGLGATSANLTLCRSAPTVGQEKRTIEIFSTGRFRLVSDKNATTCP